MIDVAELSTTNGIPSISQEKAFSLGSAAVAYILMFNVGNLRWYIYAINDLLQRRVSPLKIGYRYTISISVIDKIDLSRPSGGFGSIYKRHTYGTSKRSGSLYHTRVVAAATASSKSFSCLWLRWAYAP